MKRLVLLMLILSTLILIQGCEEKVTKVLNPEKLSPPLGLKSVTGDSLVTLIWYTSNYEGDLDGYLIYKYVGVYSNSDPKENIPSGFSVAETLKITGSSHTQVSKTVSGLSNGEDYSFLVVAARDNWTEISHTSNVIFDTPRPETAKYDTIYASSVNIFKSGYELSDFTLADMVDINVSNYSTTDSIGDFICEKFDPGAGYRLWIAGTNNGQLMDLGFMQDWDDADYAPASGYASTGFSLTCLIGHVYAIKTGDNHYGKIQITDVRVPDGWIMFKACYQTDAENREYKLNP